MIRRAALLIALLCAAAPAEAAEDCTLKRVAWLDAEFMPIGEFVIPAVIDGRQARLALDTGANLSFLSGAFVDAAGMQRKAFPGGYGRDVFGRVLRDYVVSNNVTLGPIKSTSRNEFGIMGGSRHSRWYADGTIGLASEYFRKLDVEFDFGQRKVGFYLPDHCPGQVVHWADRYDVIPVKNYAGYLTFGVTLDGKRVEALIDTGSVRTVLDKGTARRLLGLVSGSPGSEEGRGILGLSGQVTRGFQYQAKVLELPGVTLRNVPIIVADTVGTELILGMHELRFLHMYVAHKERKIYFTATPATVLARDIFAIGDLIDAGVTLARKGEYAKALGAFDQAIARDPSRPDALLARGYAKYVHADFAGAIADLSAAIGMDPGNAEAFNLRGEAHQSAGAHELALADFTTAMRLEPESTDYFGSRGVAYFALGRYADAAADFAQMSSAAPGIAYGPLWLHLTRMKQRAVDSKELTAYVAKIDRNAWPYAVVALYLGTATPDEVRAAALKGEAEEQRLQACEAAFYIGEYELARNNSAEALRLFQEAATTCPSNFIEYQGARAELKRFVPQGQSQAGQ